MINVSLQVYGADRIGSYDFVLENAGGSVMLGHCSQTYSHSIATMRLFGFTLWHFPSSPKVIIQVRCVGWWRGWRGKGCIWWSEDRGVVHRRRWWVVLERIGCVLCKYVSIPLLHVQPTLYPGDCWAMEGHAGFATIKVSCRPLQQTSINMLSMCNIQCNDMLIYIFNVAVLLSLVSLVDECWSDYHRSDPWSHTKRAHT